MARWALSLAAVATLAGPVHAEGILEGSTAYRAMGGVGLIEMPTARMSADATLAAGVGYLDPVGHAFVTWQATPWLEATARLSDVRGVADDLDRSLDIKVRLLPETGSWPGVAIGFQDILGHGATSAEYLAVSKSWGDVDVTLGLSWGYLGSRGGIGNPAKWFGNSFDVRDQTKSGVPAFKNFFAGDRMGVFAGVAYRTPIDGLEVKAEYSGVDVDKVAFGRAIKDKFPVNVGMSYRPLRWLEVGAGFIRGDTVAVNLVLRAEPPRLSGMRKAKTPPTQALTPRPAAADLSARGMETIPMPAAVVSRHNGAALTQVSKALFDAGIEAPLFELNGNEAYLSASLPPATASHQSLLAAYLVFAHTSPDVDRLTLRNRLSDDLGVEGQVFTRDLVIKLVRADAAFNDLLKAGGVTAVTMTGKDVTARVAEPLPPDEATVSALADLAPAAGGLATVRSAAGTEGTASLAELKRARAAEQAKRYLAEAGLQVSDIAVKDGVAVVEASAAGPLSESVLREAAAATLAILAESGDAIAAAKLSIARGGAVVATVEAPSGAIVAKDGAVSKGGRQTRPGMRYLPLYGYVPWSAPQPSRPMISEVSAPLTAGEAAQIFAAAERQGLVPIAARSRNGVTELAVANDAFHNTATAVGRAGRAIAAAAPTGAERIAVTQIDHGVALGRASLWRGDLEKAANHVGSPEEVWLHTAIDRGATPSGEDWLKADAYPRFSWAVLPEVKQHFGAGSEGGYKAALYATLAGRVEPWPGLALEGAISQELIGNLDDIQPRTGSAEPRVRSDIARYADEGKTAISRLIGSWTARPLKNLFLRASAGLFEPMYGGVGVEALLRPVDSAWALGADVNWVKQRDFDQLLDFRGYRVWTGHVSLYRQWPRSGFLGVMRVGRYLAGDVGATVDLSRQFANGIRIGGWATLTDMKRRDFGPDSFAKGLYIAIPLDLFLPWSSRGATTAPFTVLNRDGGQRLDRGPDLYDLTTPGTADALEAGWGSLLR